MNLADKPCYPLQYEQSDHGVPYNEQQFGLTFRERLIIALASNPYYVVNRKSEKGQDYFLNDDELSDNAMQLIMQADAIIKQMEEK